MQDIYTFEMEASFSRILADVQTTPTQVSAIGVLMYEVYRHGLTTSALVHSLPAFAGILAGDEAAAIVGFALDTSLKRSGVKAGGVFSADMVYKNLYDEMFISNRAVYYQAGAAAIGSYIGDWIVNQSSTAAA